MISRSVFYVKIGSRNALELQIYAHSVAGHNFPMFQECLRQKVNYRKIGLKKALICRGACCHIGENSMLIDRIPVFSPGGLCIVFWFIHLIHCADLISLHWLKVGSSACQILFSSVWFLLLPHTWCDIELLFQGEAIS